MVKAPLKTLLDDGRDGRAGGRGRALRRQREEGMPVLYGYSEHTLPRPDDWPRSHHVTGYWFLDDEAGWQPPPALTDFLRAGPPPVYVGFGSMASAARARENTRHHHPGAEAGRPARRAGFRLERPER